MINSKKLEYLILFLFIGIWCTVGSDPNNFLYLFDNKSKTISILSNINLKEIINLIRAIFPLILIIITLSIILKYKLFYDYNKFVYILLLIQILQIITTYYSKDTLILAEFESSIQHIGRYHWLISSIGTIFIFMIASKLKDFRFNNLLYVSLFFISIIVIYFSYIILIDYLNPEHLESAYHLDTWRESGYFFNHQIPRVTGLSRSILILLVFLLFLNFDTSIFFNFLRNCICIILGTLIFIFQSKFSVISIFIIYIFYILSSKFKIKTFIKIGIFLFIQIFLFFSISNYKWKLVSLDFERIIQEEFAKNLYIGVIDIEKKVNKEKEIIRTYPENRKKDKKDILNYVLLSGRGQLWVDGIKYFKERPILGYGSMSDRIILNKERIVKSNVINPVSNAFVYSLLSGGIFCFFLLILFFVSIREYFIKIFYFRDLENFYLKIGSLIFLLIFLRLFIENSMMLFGIDFILIMNVLYLLKGK